MCGRRGHGDLCDRGERRRAQPSNHRRSSGEPRKNCGRALLQHGRWRDGPSGSRQRTGGRRPGRRIGPVHRCSRSRSRRTTSSGWSRVWRTRCRSRYSFIIAPPPPGEYEIVWSARYPGEPRASTDVHGQRHRRSTPGDRANDHLGRLPRPKTPSTAFRHRLRSTAQRRRRRPRSRRSVRRTWQQRRRSTAGTRR